MRYAEPESLEEIGNSLAEIHKSLAEIHISFFHLHISLEEIHISSRDLCISLSDLYISRRKTNCGGRCEDRVRVRTLNARTAFWVMVQGVKKNPKRKRGPLLPL